MSVRLRTRLDFELLEPAHLQGLLQDAIRVWREVPYRVQGTDEFFSYLTDYGCQVDGELVRFPQRVIDGVLDRIGEEKRQRAGNGDGFAAPGMSAYTHGQALHICDLETNALRPATEGDLILWCHAVDALGIPERQHPTFIPTDVVRGAADFHAFATIILHSRQPHRVSVYSARAIPLFIEALRVARGSQEAVRADPVFAAKCWVNSPFMITRENVEIGMTARRLLGQPIVFGHMPVAGAAGPITVAGSLVQNTAESLALCAMRLAVDDLTSGITGTSTILDMKSGAHRQSGPDLMLHGLAGAQMHAHLFGGRAIDTNLGVAASTVTPQALHEKSLAASFSVAAGVRKLGVGSLAFSDVGSPVQLVLDCGLVDYYQHLFRPVHVDDAHVGLDSILETAPRGARYIETEHTARHFREESWLPDLIDHRVPLAWMADPSDLIERGRQQARELYARADNQCPLSAAQQADIHALIREADSLAVTNR